MKRDKALKTAEGLVSEKRASVYGDARLNHQRIANMCYIRYQSSSLDGIFSYGSGQDV